jgi:hypothetical protein
MLQFCVLPCVYDRCVWIHLSAKVNIAVIHRFEILEFKVCVERMFSRRSPIQLPVRALNEACSGGLLCCTSRLKHSCVDGYLKKLFASRI